MLAALPRALIVFALFASGAVLAQESKLLPGDGETQDIFGSAVAISGDGTTALVGAQNDDDTGSAYVFTRSGSVWAEQARLVALDANLSDFFGAAVALSADGMTALIGASGADPAGSGSGSAYVFVRSGTGWSEQAKLTASDGAVSDAFGVAVALSVDGAVALVGASGDDDHGSDSGAAYVFVRTGELWTQASKLTANAGAALDRFGRAVALSQTGTTALVGASGPDILAAGPGAAYVFVSSGSTWTTQARLSAAGGAVGDAFGRAVALSEDGSRALVGAVADDDAGSAFVFARSGTTWTEEARLVASDRAGGDSFGIAVSLRADGERALIGAFADDDAGSLSGSAYLFSLDGTTWTEETKLTASDAAQGDQFGKTVSLSPYGEYSLIGADGGDDNGDVSGSAYVIESSGATLTEPLASGSPLRLSPASPNPFSHATRLVLTTDQAGPVQIVLLDLLGREVRQLHDGPLAPQTEVVVVADGLPSGVYVVRAVTAAGTASRAVVLDQ